MAQRIDPFRGFRYLVEIDGTEQGGFQSVSGLERVTEIEPYREGGVNDHERQLAVKTTYPPLVLTRGLTDTWFWDWHQDVITGDIQRRTVSVALLDDEGSEVWRFICNNAYPSKWTGGELNAETSAVATESVELVHHGLRRL